MAKSNRISADQKMYLEHVAAHPMCCTADVVRACQRNPRAGHKWIYDSVGRLIRRGFLVSRPDPSNASKGALSLTGKGRVAIGLPALPIQIAHRGEPTATI